MCNSMIGGIDDCHDFTRSARRSLSLHCGLHQLSERADMWLGENRQMITRSMCQNKIGSPSFPPGLGSLMFLSISDWIQLRIIYQDQLRWSQVRPVRAEMCP